MSDGFTSKTSIMSIHSNLKVVAARLNNERNNIGEDVIFDFSNNNVTDPMHISSNDNVTTINNEQADNVTTSAKAQKCEEITTLSKIVSSEKGSYIEFDNGQRITYEEFSEYIYNNLADSNGNKLVKNASEKSFLKNINNNPVRKKKFDHIILQTFNMGIEQNIDPRLLISIMAQENIRQIKDSTDEVDLNLMQVKASALTELLRINNNGVKKIIEENNMTHEFADKNIIPEPNLSDLKKYINTRKLKTEKEKDKDGNDKKTATNQFIDYINNAIDILNANNTEFEIVDDKHKEKIRKNVISSMNKYLKKKDDGKLVNKYDKSFYESAKVEICKAYNYIVSQKFINKRFKTEADKNDWDNENSSVIDKYNVSINFGAMYIKHLLSSNSLEDALQKYNGEKGKKEAYACDVIRRYQNFVCATTTKLI